jgi:DNA-binding GntR family transcriptional regulator
LGALAAQFGVSTTPVREALVRLEREGVVEANAHKSFRVANLNLPAIRDFHLLHGFISGVLAERAAKCITVIQLAQLERLTERLTGAAASNDDWSWHQLNFEFHRTLNRIGGDSVLHRFLASTNRYVSRKTYPNVPGWYELATEGHAPIMDALRRRDGPSIRLIIEEHVRQAGELLIDDLRSKGGWEE